MMESNFYKTKKFALNWNEDKKESKKNMKLRADT